MNLSNLDWTIIAIYFIAILSIGVIFSKKSNGNISEYFISGRTMPWWLLGFSMVATTFSADTPNLVTGLVRGSGVSGNWGWWAFLLTGMLTVFVYSKLWRRSMVLTDIEFYELRYSGNAASFLRGFRALYLGLVFNVLVMGAVSLAAIKFGEIVLGWPAWQTLAIAGTITIAYTYFGGLRAVIITDFIQFSLAMIGSVWACWYILGLEEVGGLNGLLSHEAVIPKMSILPDFSDPNSYIPILIVPLAVQWWASYYPGAEPGGGGYIAQRMFSAKNEKHAVGATLFFNIAHYALRPWPWILIALASLIVFPELSDIKEVFPNISQKTLKNDIAYPAMLTKLPSGLLGLVSASLIAAFMSTMSTQMNLGSSYLVNDFYKRFIKPDASEKKLLNWARNLTLLSAILGMGLGLLLESAEKAFDLMLIVGAGTGLVYILRWFWWRINAYTEIVAMISSIVVAILFLSIDHGLESWKVIVIGTLITTFSWVISVFFTKPSDDNTLLNFYNKIQPASIGWKSFINKMKSQNQVIHENKGTLGLEVILTVVGSITIYSILFAIGNWIYGEYLLASGLTFIGIVGSYVIMWGFGKTVREVNNSINEDD